MGIIINKLRQRVIELKLRNVSPQTIRIMLKEILQDYVLAGIYSKGKYKDLIFIGGTALRKIYSLDRFSEDLDFDTEKAFDLKEMGEYLKAYFKSLDLDKVEYSLQQSENINRIVLKFPIIKETGLMGMEKEKLHIKIETTVNRIYEPQLFTKTIVNNPVVIKSYPLSTLMAGKILACLNRTFEKGDSGVVIKGRDYYDLIWYMGQGIMPDERVLKESNTDHSIRNVFNKLDEKVQKITKRDLIIDLETYFDDIRSIDLWCDSFQELYSNYRERYD